ncbi:hypothetical protein [Acidithiobacillus sp.]
MFVMHDNEAKRCNRTMLVDDGMTCCELPMGHDGPHQESYESDNHGKVTIMFEKGFTPVKIKALQHMIPAGETCQFEDGRNCPFLGFIGEGKGWRDFACYLSGDVCGGSRFYPDEFHKGCD